MTTLLVARQPLEPENSANTSKKTFSISNRRPSSIRITTAQFPLFDGRIGGKDWSDSTTTTGEPSAMLSL
jgi:hypothetical protein